MEDRDRLIKLCDRGMEYKNITDEKYKKRLQYELRQLDIQLNYEYFLKLYDSRKVYPNDHNSIIPYLLCICNEFDINQETGYFEGEWPDIDTDFLQDIRDSLKRDWAPEVFGKENVCEISTYGTLGIKAAMLDMTGVYGIPKDEIQAITVDMEDKDDEGHLLEWDKALELYPAFADYCQRFPHVAEAAKELIGRNRQSGIHAGGLIISSVNLSDFVPLEVRSVNKENPKGVVVAAWPEGQRAQDLGAVGLIKFDYLVVNGMQQYGIPAKLLKENYDSLRHSRVNANVVSLIKETNGIKNIFSLPGMNRDWSDISYLNDPKALEIANKGDTRCIFQMGSDGMRKLMRTGGVTSFDDIPAYSSLFRPGCLAADMDKLYCNRKTGKEKYELHPILSPILAYTYGIACYQEQITQILNKVGKIPAIHCEKVRKAISKKKLDVIEKYKPQFIENAQITLGITKEAAEEMYTQIEKWAGYGFNKSHAYAYAMISARQLIMMAYFPAHFYTAVLMEEKETDKIKHQILDARRHKVEVEPIHINKSDTNFSIVDNKIYYGFSKIKGMGEAIAQKVAAGRPYKSFEDFLTRFGTDSKVVKPLIALGAFDDPYDKETLYKFYEVFKAKSQQMREKAKRNENAIIKYNKELSSIIEQYKDQLPAEHLETMATFSEEAYKLWEEYASKIEVDEYFTYKGDVRTRKITVEKLFSKVRHKLEKSSRNFQERQDIAVKEAITLDGFDAKKKTLDKEIVKLLADTKECEKLFYGFVWRHALEESPDYTGKTIDWFLSEAESRGGMIVGSVEVEIMKVEHLKSKNNNTYYSISIEDACGQQAKVTMWSDDFSRFAEDLQVGNLVKMRVRPPTLNFKRFTFESPTKRDRHRLPEKAMDFRLCVMKRAVPKLVSPIDLSDFNFEEDGE